MTLSGKGGSLRPAHRLETGDLVHALIEPVREAIATPEDIALAILYEDDRLVVIDKPAGLTVHPGGGTPSGTLANALAHHFGSLSDVQGPERPGIVHRLDKDTSGVILVARDDAAHHHLADQFRERTVQKEYLCVVRGVPELDSDLVDAPIGPHKRIPTRMAIRLDVGRPSTTLYEVVERYPRHALVRCRPRSGRTHQIRVHMRHAGFPIVSDRFYGGVEEPLTAFCPRQALHARRITVEHPGSGERVTFEAPIPADFQSLIDELRSRRP